MSHKEEVNPYMEMTSDALRQLAIEVSDELKKMCTSDEGYKEVFDKFMQINDALITKIKG